MYSIYDAPCPYCNNGLKRVPKSKTRCPNCGNYIYVRTDIKGQKFAVTEYEKSNIDRMRHQKNGCFSSTLGRTAVSGAIGEAARGCSPGCLLSVFSYLFR